MDAVIFDDSPMASYLEGQGNGKESGHESDRSLSVSSDRPEFAPRGLAKLRTSLLPPPLKIRAISRQQSRSPSRLGIAHNDAMNATMSDDIDISKASPRTQPNVPGENEQFLERFRYLIVASQLLTEQISTVHYRRSRRTKSDVEPDEFSHSAPYSPEGAIIAGIFPFVLALVGQWVLQKARIADVPAWVTLIAILLLTISTSTAAYIYSQRKIVKEIRRKATESLANLIVLSQGLDKSITAALNFIQEVEIVSRGYDITSPLPPISRIEERTQQRRCLKLRHELAACLSNLCHEYIEVHHALTPYAAQEVVEQYHDIYDVSRRDYQEVGLLSPQTVPEDQESLKNLKGSFAKQFVSRKVVLCDLLAFSTEIGELDREKWHVAVEAMQRLASCMSGMKTKLKELLQSETGADLARAVQGGAQEENVDPSLTDSAGVSLEEDTISRRVQTARLTALSQSIRTLNAKMHLFKEQLDEASTNRTPADISAIIIHQYDSAGADLRSLLSEWEKGKQLMTLQSTSHKRHSSHLFPKSPMSPTQSISGSTAVGGSPSEALRLLNGENTDDSDRPLHDHEQGTTSEDDEIFEAISLPKQRPPSTANRQERIAKMKEERLRRALFQEKQDANTNMLRELETVIKHRPRGRTSMRNTTL